MQSDQFHANDFMKAHIIFRSVLTAPAIAAMGACFVLAGCASYIPPRGRADFNLITSPTIQEGFAAKPTAQFPVGIAAIRVQAPNYRSYSTDQQGGVFNGQNYSVILVKEAEDYADIERLEKLPDVAGIISISRLLLPPHLRSEQDLREAAARLKAEMMLIYTFDTTFHENDAALPLSIVTLGLSPTRHISVHVTASALALDTRTGFVYAAFEASEKRASYNTSWGSSESADRARLDAERTAFKSLVEEFEKNWPGIVDRAKKGA
jgi:hypothetical protein